MRPDEVAIDIIQALSIDHTLEYLYDGVITEEDAIGEIEDKFVVLLRERLFYEKPSVGD